MVIRDEIRALEAELSAAGIPIDAFLLKAGVDRSSWTRWKAGSFSPRMKSWTKVQDTMREVVSTSLAQSGAA